MTRTRIDLSGWEDEFKDIRLVLTAYDDGAECEVDIWAFDPDQADLASDKFWELADKYDQVRVVAVPREYKEGCNVCEIMLTNEPTSGWMETE